MGTETILLAQNWNEKRFVDGSYVSEKFDGVPARIGIRDKKWQAISRQGETLLSVEHIFPEARAIGVREGIDIIGELWIPNKDFAYISGKVRAHECCPDLHLMVYDVVNTDKPMWDYKTRIKPFLDYIPMDWGNSRIHSVYTTNLGVLNASGLPLDKQGVLSRIAEVRTQPKAEGIIVRSPDHVFKAGKRSWGLMRWKHNDTIDLRIVDINEALTKHDDPTGMVGSFEVLYNGYICNVGAGKLKHTERKQIWENQDEYLNKTIEILYKPDPTYKGLREATFQRFRPDKD